MASRSGSTFEITADASQALATFKEVHQAAVDAQKISAAGTPGASTKFTSGQYTQARREAQGYLEDLEKIKRATQELGRGKLLPEGFFPGFKGGNAAQAAQFQGVQRQQNIATNIGTKAALAGIEVPKDFVSKILTGFQDNLQGQARAALHALQALPATKVFNRDAIGTTRQVQLAQGSRSALGIADTARTTVQDRQQATRDAAAAESARQRAERADRDQRERDDNARAARERNEENRRLREERVQQDREATEARRRAEFEAGQTPTAGGASGSGPGRPIRLAGGTADDEGPRRGSSVRGEIADELEARKREAELQRRNVALLRDESTKQLRPGIFQGANDLIVDFRNGLLSLYERTRAGERQIPRDAPEFQSALTGALQTRGQASEYIAGKRASDPNSVIDIDAKTTAVIEDGITRIFKAMQNGERETIATLPEFERNFTKLAQILKDRADDVALAARRAAEGGSGKILSVSRNRTVDFTGDTPRVLKQNTQGQREQFDTGPTAASFRESISQAYDQLSQRARKEMLDEQRLVRPGDFVDLGNGFFADIGNKQRAIYHDLGAGVDAITETTRGFATRSKALNRLVERTPEGDNVLSQARRGPLTGAEASDKARQSATAEDERRSRARGVLETRAENEDSRRRRASEVQTARAESEDARRTKKAETNLRARGQLETRAASEDARRRRASEVQIAQAENEDGRRTRKAETNLRARGQLETRAATEGARRRRASEVQITQAENEGARRRRAGEVQITQAENEGARRRRASEVQITQAENEGTRRRRAGEVQIARAESEDARRARKSETNLRARGQLETRAATEDARRRRAGEVQITQAENEGERRRRAGEVQIARAENEDARRTRKSQTSLRARGVLETQAENEGARRRRAGEVQIARAETEDRKRTARKQTEAQAAIQQLNQQRLEQLRASGRAIDVPRNRTVDFSGATPKVFQTTAAGGARQLFEDKAPVAVREAVTQGFDRLAQVARKEFIDAERAARPQDFVQLSERHFADIGNRQRQINQITDHGYQQLVEGAHGFDTQNTALSKKIRTNALGENVPLILPRTRPVGVEAEAKLIDGAYEQNARDRASQLRKAFLDSARAANPEQFVQLSDRHFADIGNKLKTIYEITGKGYDEVAATAASFPRLDRKLQDLVRTDPTTGENFPRALPRGPLGGAEKEARNIGDAYSSNLQRTQAELTKAFLDAERAAHPEQFVQLSEKFFADISNKQRTIYEITEKGYEELAASAKGFATKTAQLGRLVKIDPTTGENVKTFGKARPIDRTGAQEEENYLQSAYSQQAKVKAVADRRSQEARNALNLRQGGEALAPGTIPFGQYVGDVRGSILQLYKKTKDGYERLGRDTEDYVHQQGKLVQNLSRHGRPGIGGAIAQGLTSGGLGGGGSEDGNGILEGLARSGATTAKYAALGTVLYGLIGAAQAAFSEFEDFDDSVTELQVAFGETDKSVVASQGYINDLADSASQAGSNVGEAMDVAASAVRAFSNATGESSDSSIKDLQQLSAGFAREASRIAILTKTTLTDAQGNLKATQLGFDIPFGNASRVTDALANAKLVGGGDEKQIGQGVANISVAAKEAGFSLEEMGNIISDIQAKTDQGGTLIAQRLSRVFSIVGGTAGQTAIRRLNAQLPDAQKIAQGEGVTTADQVKQLSAVYKDLDVSQRKTLTNQLGGTANARELIILLQDASNLTSEANLDSAGKGAEEYERRLKNVRAQIAQITGNIKNLIAAISNSGLLAPLGIMLKTTLAITTGARTLAETFDSISPKLRTIAGALLGMLILFKAIQAINRTPIVPIPGQSALGAAGQVGKPGFKNFLRAKEAEYLPGRVYYREQNAAQRAQLATVAGAGVPGNTAAAAAARAAARADRLQRIKDTFDPGRSAADPIKGTYTAVKTGLTNLGNGIKSFNIRRMTEFDVARNNQPGARGYLAGLRGSLNTSLTEGGVSTAPGPATSRGIGNRVRSGLSSGRAQINESGLFGGLAILSTGATAIINAKQAGERIEKAVAEFGALKTLPETFGIKELNDSAANLRSAAEAIKASSSGLFGTISNALRGNITGAKAQDATELADFQELSAKRLQAIKDRILRGRVTTATEAPDALTNKEQSTPAFKKTASIQDISSTLDISSSDNLSASIDALSKSGRNATDIMAAFQLKLKGIATDGEAATRKLSTFESDTVSTAVANKAVVQFQNLRPEDNSLTSSQAGIDNPNLAALRDSLGIGYLASRDSFLISDKVKAPVLAAKAQRGIDANALGDQVNTTVSGFLKQGKDINDPDQRKILQVALEASLQSVKGVVLDPKYREAIIASTLGAVVSESKAVTSVTDSSASFADLGAAIPALAENAGAEKAVNKALGTKTGTQVSETADLTSAREVLKQEQDGLNTLTQKALTSDADQTELDALVAKIKAQKIVVADAVVANLASQYELVAASQIPENTTANINANIDELTKEINSGRLSDTTRHAKEVQRLQLQAQLPASQRADKFAGQREKLDSRDTLGLDKVNIDEIQATIDKGGLSGKALSDKKIELADAQRKQLNDQADLALATKLATLDPNSAVDQATSNLKTAKANLDKQLAGTAEYVSAQKAYNDAKKADAVAKLAATGLKEQLGIDLSNPVQVARQQEKAATDALDLARKQNESPDVIDQKRLDVRNAQLASSAAAFQQFLSNVQTADQLGDISHRAYMDMLSGRLTALQAEALLLNPKSNGFQQNLDEQNQLRQALKAAGDELSGQFNIGDIKIPTPYQVRRAIKAGNTGSILANNSPNSTAGNVTNDTSTKSVVLNGIPIQQVIALIEDLFGVKVKTKNNGRKKP